MAEVIIHQLTGTPEEVEKNRRNLEKVIERIVSRIEGCPMEVKLL